MISLKDQAIHTALLGDWQQAITFNLQLLAETPHHIDTLNRLAFAYHASGETKLAKETYQKVLALDEQNPIALKNLKRLNGSTSLVGTNNHHLTTGFIEEHGKTKIVKLVNVAESKILSSLQTGTQVMLSIKRSKIFTLDAQKQYIGMLPDDIAKRLIKFMEGGNLYEACIKSIANREVTIFIREVKRAEKFRDQPSFLPNITSKVLPQIKKFSRM